MTLPDLSDMPVANIFVVEPGFRADNPLSALMDRSLPEGHTAYARVDVELPLGCPFSLFLVRGYPKGAELPCRVASLVISRELAQALAEGLDDPDILEVPVKP